MKAIFYPLMVLFIFGCEDVTTEKLEDINITQAESQSSIDKNVTVRFLDFSDFHAHLTAHKSEVLQDDGTVLLSMRGGIARTATKIDELRHENTIVMNIGDTYHGGAEALFSAGNDIVDIINAVGFDIGVPGNWDFAYGPMATNARFASSEHSDVKRPNFKHLAANMKFKDPERATNYLAQQFMRSTFNYEPGDDFLSPTTMIEKDGIKIGMIGISSDIVERMYPIFAMNINILQGESNYVTLINTLSAQLKANGANMVVVMSELGLQKDKRLADIINENSVDIFFSAHTHEVVKVMIDSDSGAKVVEAGDDTFLGQLDAKFENNKLSTLEWKLHEITQDIEPKESIKAMVYLARQPYLKQDPNIEALMIQPEGLSSLMSSFFPTGTMPVLHHSLEEVLSTTTHSLSRKDALESSYNNVFTDMLKTFTHADVAMTPGFRYANTIASAQDEIWQIEDNIIVDGHIHTEDVYRFLPVPSGIATGKTSVANLKDIIEINLENVFSTEIFNQNGGWFDGFSGVSMRVDLSAGNKQRLQSLEFNETKADSDIITIAGCTRPTDLEEGILCSYSNFSEVNAVINPDTQEQFLGVDFMIYAFQNGLLDSIEKRESITDVSNTPLWPLSPYVQPLEGAR